MSVKLILLQLIWHQSCVRSMPNKEVTNANAWEKSLLLEVVKLQANLNNTHACQYPLSHHQSMHQTYVSYLKQYISSKKAVIGTSTNITMLSYREKNIRVYHAYFGIKN